MKIDVEKSLERAPVFLLCIALACVFIPFLPLMPQAPLDASWALGMNEAAAEGMVFGRDVMFTFGPYSAVQTRFYHPGTDLGAVLVSAYLTFCYAVAVILLAGGKRRYLLALLAIAMLGMVYSRDALFFSYLLVVGAYCYRHASRDGETRRGLLVLALLFSPFGVLPLIKGSLLAGSALIGGLAVTLFLSRRMFGSAMVAVTSGVGALVVFWVTAGQPVGALPEWLQSLMDLMSGYTQAMSYVRTGRGILSFLLISLVLLALVYVGPHERNSARTYVVLLFAGYLFLVFKGGFVREDVQVFLASSGLLLAVIYASLLFPSRALLILLVPTVAAVFHINHGYGVMSPRTVVVNAVWTLESAWHGMHRRLLQNGRLDRDYEEALARLRSAATMRQLEGTTDIYSYHQAFLLASGNTWNPRPVIQSYAAFTPWLMGKNKDHLLGSNAPDNIAFRLETIDSRLPAAEDGASWPVLLAKYRLSGADTHFLYLRRDDAATMPSARVIGQGTHAFMDQVAVPDSVRPVYARIDIEPSFAGKLLGILYRPSAMLIRLDTVDGKSSVFRIIPGMAKTDVMVSPLVESTGEFAKLFSHPDQDLASRRVKSITIAPAHGNWHWAPRYRLEFVEY